MTAVEVIAQISRTVRQALRHQQYRYEDMRRDLGLKGQGQSVATLGVNIEPFDYRLSFDGAATLSENVSNSSAEDLMVFVYDRGTDTDLRFDLDANPSLYEMTELDEHRRRLLRFIDQVLQHPGAPLAELDILGEGTPAPSVRMERHKRAGAREESCKFGREMGGRDSRCSGCRVRERDGKLS